MIGYVIFIAALLLLALITEGPQGVVQRVSDIVADGPSSNCLPQC